MMSTKVLAVKSVPENALEVTRGNWLVTPVRASAKAGGVIFLPLEEIDMNAPYTFECEEGGKLYRWTDQFSREIRDGLAVFHLADADPEIKR
jgi:hypothetical protein